MKDFERIYAEYLTPVHKYILSLCRNEAVAEEIVSDTFFKALKSIDSFKGECTVRVWLCQIAKNTYFSYLKKQKPQQSLDEAAPYPDDFELHTGLESKEAARAVHKRLHNLAEPYKEVFTLRVFGELAFGEIAEIFSKTESWARVTFHRAKLKLQEGE